MAPEQASARHQDVGPAADVHALGAMFYEMLTGVPPFLADTVKETLDRIVSQQAVPPRQLHADVPLRLQTICLRCLEKDPGQRYPSARELVDDLQRWLRRGSPETHQSPLFPAHQLLRELPP